MKTLKTAFIRKDVYRTMLFSQFQPPVSKFIFCNRTGGVSQKGDYHVSGWCMERKLATRAKTR